MKVVHREAREAHYNATLAEREKSDTATRRERPPEAEPIGHGAEEIEGPRRVSRVQVDRSRSASAEERL